MNDRQKVAPIATVVACLLIGLYWIAGLFFPTLLTDQVLVAAVPVIIAIAVLSPVIRDVGK
ncbi:MAG: hypothetical protein K9G27_09580 [Sphingomonadaceae bacterium]|jgi:hypothetical protein|uniref:hypothetical protein n=1 Tax=Sphingorhabdus sp. TaxID=1902408 RepID=UPI002FDA1F54|nr:hypothetical protein [Sphingomonadaceae bacterium]